MQTITLSNDVLSVSINSLGAEVVSVRDASGCEYIWQGDAKFWKGRSPLLFPFCGRCHAKSYECAGRRYEIDLHGFARHSEFAVVHADGASATLKLVQNENTLRVFPFKFELNVTYSLSGNRLSFEANVMNPAKRTLPFAFGLHHGFNVPLGGDGRFTDWILEFDEVCGPDKFILSSGGLQTGCKAPQPLDGGRIIALRHGLFDDDAIFLSRAASGVTLRRADGEGRSVHVSYPDFPYIGFWHTPHSKAPFVCIEPWTGLPGTDGAVEDIETEKTDMFRLPKGVLKTLRCEIDFRG